MTTALINATTMSNTAIAAAIGQRIEHLRLSRNLTQQALAEAVGITPKSYRQLIAGGGKFENVIGVLRALDCLDLLNNFIPEPGFSPIQQLKLQGKQRKRARPSKTTHNHINEPNIGW